MTPFDIFETIDRLRRGGEAFCVATVVRTADATSAKAGAKAAVTAAGIEGHLGGACVTRAVRQAAVTALEQGAPQLIRVKPREDVVEFADGMQLFDSGCPSGGTADILVEPYLPPPLLAIIGETPIAEAVATQAGPLGMRVLRVAPAALTELNPGPQDFVLIASQGKGDSAALRAALESEAGHIQMIASARKAAVLRERLIAAGVPTTAFARLTSPAGLSLGAVDPPEIALSVLAQVVQWRRAGQAAAAARQTG
ncbi:MAG: XdhC/CoxI family protein [Pseudomonadota bacterium]